MNVGLNREWRHSFIHEWILVSRKYQLTLPTWLANHFQLLPNHGWQQLIDPTLKKQDAQVILYILSHMPDVYEDEVNIQDITEMTLPQLMVKIQTIYRKRNHHGTLHWLWNTNTTLTWQQVNAMSIHCTQMHLKLLESVVIVTLWFCCYDYLPLFPVIQNVPSNALKVKWHQKRWLKFGWQWVPSKILCQVNKWRSIRFVQQFFTLVGSVRISYPCSTPSVDSVL